MAYAIEKIDTGERVRRFDSLPKSLEVNIDGRNRRIISPVQVGDEGLGYRLIELREIDFMPPGKFYDQGQDVETRQGNVVTVTRQWIPWEQSRIDEWQAGRLDDIAAEISAVDAPVRAALLVVLDEFNRHAAVHREILQAAAGASSLATFKTAMAQIQGIPPRQPSDLLNAVRAKLEPPST